MLSISVERLTTGRSAVYACAVALPFVRYHSPQFLCIAYGKGVATEQYHNGTFIGFIHATIFEILSDDFQLRMKVTKFDLPLVAIECTNRHHHRMHFYLFIQIVLIFGYFLCFPFCRTMNRWRHKKQIELSPSALRTKRTHVMRNNVDRCMHNIAQFSIETTALQYWVIDFEEKRLISV